MKRRNFLRTGALGAAAAGATAVGILRHPRRAAAGWGAWPADKLDALIPSDRQAQNVLEVFLYGGMSAFDTFYAVPSWGEGNQTFLHAFPEATASRFASCGFPGELTEPFAEDAAGTLVHLGPWVTPLRQRPDLLARMRIIVQRHDSLPHEGANPLALTGSRLGSPRLAGVGASIQRHFLERPDGLRSTPYAYILYPGVDFPTDNVRAASSVGLHPGSARPLSLVVDANSEISNLLARSTVGDQREAFDAAIDHYLRDYHSRLRPGGKGAAVRSAERSNYTFAHFARRAAEDLQGVLASDLFQVIGGEECGVNEGIDMPAMQARLAANLLTRTSDRPRYVQWVDAGLRPHPAAGHDTHQQHVAFASVNVTHTLRQLVGILNEPGEDDPSKIDLDRTMVVINTEFGRTPHIQGDDGLNHWPQGMVTVVLGGPVTAAERGIYGVINDQGFAQTWISPAENRMMVMMALGIYPFSSQTFAVSDVGGGVKDELAAARRIKETYFGIPA